MDGDLLDLLLWAMMLGFYLLPTLVAWFQEHDHLYAIAALNLLIGWTLVGWFGALAWAFKPKEHVPNPKTKKRKKRTARILPHHPVTHSDLARRLGNLPEV